MARKTILTWTPRVLLIAFALFLVLFSFDVFEDGKSAGEIAIAFIMHNIPSAMLLLLVLVAWRREWIGALVCVLLAVAYVVWAWGQFPLSVYFVMAGPLVLIAVLYTVNWRLRTHAT